MDRAAHKFSRARNREAGDRKLEKEAEGGRAVFVVVEKAARLVRLRLA
jgi:hypothetical protein